MTLSEELRKRIRAVVGPGGLAAEPFAPFERDIRGYVRGAAGMVVLPSSTAEAAAVVGLLAAAGVAFVPQGGNTGLCAGAIPGPAAEVVIGLSRMNRIGPADPVNLSMTVEAGALLADVRAAAAAAGCAFPLSIGAEGSCQIGGNIATNAGGHNVLRHRMTRGLVLGLEVVLADGRVWDGLRALRKDNTGYDLKQLFIGAEGTLGLVTRATLALVPAEARTETALVAVASVEAAVALLVGLRRSAAGLLTAFEYLSGHALGAAVRNVPGQTCPLVPAPAHALLIETAMPAILPAGESLLEAMLAPALAAGLVEDAVLAASEGQRRALWRLREAVVEGLRREGGLVTHDIALPIDRLAAFLGRCGSDLQATFPGCRPAPFGHLGDGNLHYNVQFAAGADPGGFLDSRAAVNRLVHDLVMDFGGSFSAEHGVGQLKLADMARYKSALELELMERLRAALDPRRLANPGKVLPGA